MITRQLQDVLYKGIRFLYRKQSQSGEFSSLVSRDQSFQGISMPDRAVFPTSCIVYSLGFVGGRMARSMQRKGLQFIEQEMHPPGLWRYSNSRSQMQFDPDLDTTCCSSFLLRDRARDIGSGSNIGLILGNRNVQGLFLTWVRRPDCANDVDSVVNANVLLYLGERPETMEACNYLNRIVNSGKEAGSYYYYLDNLALYYMVSRAYFKGIRRLEESCESIERKTLARLTSRQGAANALLMALGICTLMNCSAKTIEVLREAVLTLADSQREDGSWPLVPFYAGPEPPAPLSIWYGSEELTTAFCVEATARFLDGQGCATNRPYGSKIGNWLKRRTVSSTSCER